MSEQRDLRADLELCQKATPGPWKPFRDTFEPAIYTKLEDGCRGVCVARLEGLHGERQRNDANFIAAARTGWPEAIERAIKAEEELEKQQQLFEAQTGRNVEIIKRLNERKREVCEANDLLSAQAAELREGLAMIRDNPELWKRPKIGGQDKYAGMPPLVRKIDSILSSPDPGAEIMERMKKLEAVAEAARDYREHEYLASTDKWHEVIDRLDKSLDALAAVTPCP